MPPLVIGLIVDGIRNAPVPFFLRPILRGVASNIETTFLKGEYDSHFDFLESQLPSSINASAGSFPSITTSSHLTAADILISFALLAAVEKGLVSEDKYPHIVAYTKAIGEQEGYKRAIKRYEDETGGKYELV